MAEHVGALVVTAARLLCWFALLGLMGCSYRVRLRSDPQPVEATLPSGRVVLTPSVVRLKWTPFGRQWVTFRAPGYRPLTIDLRRREVRLLRMTGQAVRHPKTLLGDVRGDVFVVLVPEHGPAGSWTSEDVP